MTSRKDPLDEFVNALKNPVIEKQKQNKQKQNHEDVVFSVIISLFIVGLILGMPSAFIGKVVFESNTEIIYLNQQINDSSDIRLSAKGNITSVWVTGKFIGNGSAKIYMGDRLVIDTAQFETKDNLITGFVVNEELTGAIEETDETVVNETTYVFEENTSLELQDQAVNELLEDSSENITDILTNDTTVSVEENITVESNETIDINLSIEFNETAEEIEVNITDKNLTVEINKSIVENITLLPEVNLTVEDQPNLDIIEFDIYCLETCNINYGTDRFTLSIELDNMILNLTSVAYKYVIPEEDFLFENNVILNESIKLNETNLTLNIIEINLTNATLIEANISINITELNLSANITSNLTDLYINITFNETNFSFDVVEFELFNLTSKLDVKGLSLLNYTFVEDSYRLKIGKDWKNYAVIETSNLSLVDMEFITSDDARLNSKIFGLRNINAKVYFESKNPEVLLECVQYEDTCKKWKISEQGFSTTSKGISADLIPGVYTTADIDKENRVYVPVDFLNYNSNCWGCVQEAYCDYRGFNAVTNQGDRNFTFKGQLGFDILNLDDNIESAEICAYLTYLYNNTPTINYIINSENRYCGNPSENYVPSNKISYGIIEGDDEWVCIPITEILEYNLYMGYSDMFVNWEGEDIQGEVGPVGMYEGIHSLNYCDNYNPSGANDCRPYMRINYK